MECILSTDPLAGIADVLLEQVGRAHQREARGAVSNEVELLFDVEYLPLSYCTILCKISLLCKISICPIAIYP